MFEVSTPTVLSGMEHRIGKPDVAQSMVIALAGQPNVGKSTVFNLLTGLSQHVGNWPGKTVEQKIGSYVHNGLEVKIVDLPGTYSLTANSEDERLARDFIIKERPDVVIVILNAAALERNLYLVAELLCLPAPLILGLNMMDVAKQQGIQIEPRVLEAALGVPVIQVTATKGQGIHELIGAAISVAGNPQSFRAVRPDIREDHRPVLEEIHRLIKEQTPYLYPAEWVALKLLEGDEEITRLMQLEMAEKWKDVQAILMQHEDAILAIASGRYEWIGRMIRAAVVKPKTGQITLTDKIDRMATHPVIGMGILLGIIGLLLWLSYAIGSPIQNWLETNLVQASATWLLDVLGQSPTWIQGLLVDGVVGGVGTVLTLLPILILFFAFLGLLEDVGYMSRAAYVMDRFMHMMGLHGKSFIPLLMGFGCNVPAIMGSRIIESRSARLTTILLTPLVPCTARMAVIALLAPIFFYKQAMWVMWGLVALSLAVLLGLGVILHHGSFAGDQKAFIMELPLYHFPSLRTIWLSVWVRSKDFLKVAGSLILVVSILLWMLAYFPAGRIEESYLAIVGHWLAPLGSLMGLDWRVMVALLTSFVRKENTIPTLAVLYGVGTQGTDLAEALRGTLMGASGLAFLAVQILFIPCLATVAAIRQETRSWRWTITSILLLLIVSFSIGILIYQVACLVGLGK